jgi:sugar O-acyltransferase (sialic acid O-acetyltransferase NeuD family)
MKQGRELIIIGTGLFPEVAKCYFDRFSEYSVVGFACHAAYRTSETIYNLPLYTIEDLSSVHPPGSADVFVALGYREMNKMRRRVYEELRSAKYEFASFIHPNVYLWDSTVIGENVFIFEDNTIQPFTSIGNNTILWSGNHIGHHSTIGNHCFLSSHVVVSGSCRIGDHVFIGVNATIHDSVEIAQETLIGAGAVVSKSTREKEVFVPYSTKVFPKNSQELGF